MPECNSTCRFDAAGCVDHDRYPAATIPVARQRDTDLDGFVAQVMIPVLYAVVGVLVGIGLGWFVGPLAMVIGMIVGALIGVAFSPAT